MRDAGSAQAALQAYTSQTDAWLDDHHALCDPIVTSIGLLSLAHLLQRAETFGVAANSAITATAHRLLDLVIARPQLATNHAVCNVFWALARLRIPPASIVPAYEAALADMFLATRQESNLIGISSVLWSMSILGISPLDGKLLKSIVDMLQECLQAPDLDCAQHMQVWDMQQVCTKLHMLFVCCSSCAMPSISVSQQYHMLFYITLQ